MPPIDWPEAGRIWPSLVVSTILIGLWVDYAIGAARAFAARQTRGVFREYVVSLVLVAASVVLAVGVVAAWTGPGEPDYIALAAISVVRVMMLSVGAWLAWDRRKHPL